MLPNKFWFIWLDEGAAVVVVLCFQSVPINTKIVSSNLNPVHGEYLDSNIMW
jgi:hypothetical protein